MKETYYELLDVDRSAGIEEIKSAYRRISKLVHPDRGGTNGLFRQIQDAYDTLIDPERRAEYDRGLDRQPGDDGDGSEFYDGDDFSAGTAPGWERVDVPGGFNRGNYRNQNGDSQHVWNYGHGSPYGNVTGRSGEISSFIKKHPAGFVTAVGVIMSGAGSTIGLFGLLMCYIGLLSMFGKWRIGRRRPVYLEGWRLFGAGLKESMRIMLVVLLYVMKAAIKA